MEPTFTNYFKGRRGFIAGGVLGFLGIFIIFRVIIPLVSSIGSTNQRIEDQKVRNESLRSTIAAIESINNAEIQSNLTVAQTALPQNKDILLIYTSLLNIANSLNMTVVGFTVQVGQVYMATDASPSASLFSKDQKKLLPTMEAKVELTAASSENLFQFPSALTKSLPLAEVESYTTDENKGIYDVVFYYKPLNSITLSQQDTIKPLTGEDNTLLDKLKALKK